MGLILAVLLLVLLLGGWGFSIHALWVVAIVVLFFWVAGFATARGQTSGGRGRWYRW